MDRKLNEAELVWTKTDGTKYDFNCFVLPLRFIEKIFNYEITLDEAIEDQTKSKILINKLNDYTPRIPKKPDEKNRVSECAIKLSNARDKLLIFLRKEFFWIKITHLRQKKKNQKRKDSKNLSNILRINQKILPLVCLKIILILTKKLFETKDKKENK